MDNDKMIGNGQPEDQKPVYGKSVLWKYVRPYQLYLLRMRWLKKLNRI